MAESDKPIAWAYIAHVSDKDGAPLPPFRMPYIQFLQLLRAVLKSPYVLHTWTEIETLFPTGARVQVRRTSTEPPPGYEYARTILVKWRTVHMYVKPKPPGAA